MIISIAKGAGYVFEVGKEPISLGLTNRVEVYKGGRFIGHLLSPEKLLEIEVRSYQTVKDKSGMAVIKIEI